MRKKITHLNQRRSSTASVTIEDAITAFFRRCQAKNLSPYTISFYKYRLLAFQRYLDAEQLPKEVGMITSSIIRDFIADQNMRVSAATADDSFVTVRALFTYLVKDDVVTDNPMRGVERPKTKKVIIITFTTEQIQAMLGVCGNDFVGIRNRALILQGQRDTARVQEILLAQSRSIQALREEVIRLRVAGDVSDARLLELEKAIHYLEEAMKRYEKMTRA